MNDQEKFEQQLRKQPFRSVPAEWRSQMLSAAAGEHRTERGGIGRSSNERVKVARIVPYPRAKREE